MCGIFGSFSFNQTKNNYRNSLNAIEHRGPDDEGFWSDDVHGILLAHKRLSIVDLSSSGHQPMHSPSDRYTIIFNGEIYNHRHIRSELEAVGTKMQWRGHSDTETLLAGFDRWGIISTVNRAIGMFAFAVWDKEIQTLTLCRDRIGEKPLYYSLMNETFLFGSDLASFKVHDKFTTEIDRDALALFMRHSYIPAPYTIYKNTFKLEPGTCLTISLRDHELKTEKYWNLDDVITNGLTNSFKGGPDDAVVELERMLLNSVNQQMLASDVPLGAFLSGGIDSSLIVSLMQAQSSNPIKTFTIGFDDVKFNEAIYSKQVADHLGTDHTELYVSPQQALDIIPDLPSLYSEPFADSSQIATFLVSKLAREKVTVSLTGDAGDELFCGYRTYPIADNIKNKVFSIPYNVRTNIAGAASSLLSFSSLAQKLEKISDLVRTTTPELLYRELVSRWSNPNELVINSEFLSTNFNSVKNWPEDMSYIHKMMATDQLTYLPDNNLCKVDRAAMGVSLETRVPFLDHRIVEFSWRLPLEYKLRNGISKWPLRQILYKYIPKHLIERPKMGFSVPLAEWLRGPLREWGEDLLNETRLVQEGYLNAQIVRKKWTEHLSGRRNWQHHLWNVLMFQSWLEHQKNG